MLFSVLHFIACMLFKIEPYSAFIMKDISFHRAFTFSRRMGLMVLEGSFPQLPFPGYHGGDMVLGTQRVSQRLS